MIISLLFKFRRTAVVQRIISPFSRLKGGLPYNRNAGSPSGTIDQTLLAAGAAGDAQRNTPSPANLGSMVPQQAVLQAMAAGAAAQPKQQTQPSAGVNPARPPMREAHRVPPPLLVPPIISKPNPTARNNNRNSPTPSPTSPAFTPSPLSSHPPNSPGWASSSYAHYAGAPPNDDPNVKEGKDMGRSSSMRSSLGSMASSSAVLSPTLMSWPMPPATKGSKTPSPTPISAGDGAVQSRQTIQGQQLSPEQQWVNFQQPGQAVIRINQGQKRGNGRRLA
ncbi:hypothetical protein QBC46DRAFT_379059 [Diplogelasinospora grovesii]|uniref:Uncharacterized protein n=1 Tax=Diplogelasinospora grovesii TaxID=303347 RepID=A0AAN6S739_9PEZI|nr:hypothetical protein QBC46DRAFT_379059 [Diplogelasinospora grovesii]